MRKCDLCNEPATHYVVYDRGASEQIAYLCQYHVNKSIRTPIRIEEIIAKPITTAKCILCGETKPIEEFYPYTDLRGVKRRRRECKKCNLEQRKIQRLKKK